jgi:hypothetical protein
VTHPTEGSSSGNPHDLPVSGWPSLKSCPARCSAPISGVCVASGPDSVIVQSAIDYPTVLLYVDMETPLGWRKKKMEPNQPVKRHRITRFFLWVLVAVLLISGAEKSGWLLALDIVIVIVLLLAWIGNRAPKATQ